MHTIRVCNAHEFQASLYVLWHSYRAATKTKFSYSTRSPRFTPLCFKSSLSNLHHLLIYTF
jgi:hypothetical protein